MGIVEGAWGGGGGGRRGVKVGDSDREGGEG